eukprot:NODE_951_length_2817_cov_0.118102.p2 type:complete len:340 gc:universal NODE_951_length_2817_cov_0.118102:227-1246(+)
MKLMKKQISVIFGATLLWVLIILNQYSTESTRINTPERSFFQVNCNTSHPVIKEKTVTVTTTKIVLKTECPQSDVRKENSQENLINSCESGECRSKAGNCRNDKCEWDSGWGLQVDDFQPPRKAKYTWEKGDTTHKSVLNYEDNQIPTIFHQSWKDRNVPNKFLEWEKSCSDLHLDWDQLLWTDEDNRQLIASEYPWLLYAYDRLRGGILRADFVRYVYLHHFGGVYADLDVECIKPADDLIKGKTIILGVLGDDYNFIHNIPNAILASQKGHPFWLFLLNRITMMMHQNDKVEATTGPIILRDAYRLFIKYEEYRNDFYVAPPGILYGVVFYIHLGLA